MIKITAEDAIVKMKINMMKRFKTVALEIGRTAADALHGFNDKRFFKK